MKIPFIDPVWISLKTTFVSTIIVFFAGIFLAYVLFSYKGKWKTFFDVIISLPLVLPPTVLGYLLLIVFGRNSIVYDFLKMFNVSLIFSWPATVLTACIVSLPLMYHSAKSGFENINPEMIQASRTLGKNEWQTFIKVMLPLSKPALIAGVLLSFSRALGEFGATLMFAGNIPGKTQTLSIAIYFAVASGNFQQAFSWVIIMLSMSLLSIIMLNIWRKK